MKNNKTPPKVIKPGDWILTERLTYGRFGHPLQVTSVVGSRIYYTVTSEGEPDREKYCAAASVLRVVPSRDAGIAAWNEQWRLYEILEAERGAAQARFKAGMNAFFDNLKTSKEAS